MIENELLKTFSKNPKELRKEKQREQNERGYTENARSKFQSQKIM